MAELMRHVDLCSGIGGFAYAFQTVGLSKPVLFCDIEPWSRQVLAKHWPDVPISDDVKELASDPRRLVPDCDILTAGYPCQPFSVAGQQRGEEDDRHIWPEIFAIVQAKRPAWCVFENVSGHITLGLDQVLSDLEGEGYAIQPFVIPACAVDAPHRRDRVWIVGHAQNDRRDGRATQIRRQGQTHQSDQPGLGVRCEPIRPSENVADTQRERQIQRKHEGRTRHKKRLSEGRGENVADTNSQRGCGWYAQRQDAEDDGQSPGYQEHRGRNIKSRICHLVDGLPTRMDGFDGWEREPEDIPRVTTGIKQRAARLKGLGNAIVPQIAMNIGLTIKAVEDGQV